MANKILIYKFNLNIDKPLRIGGDDNKSILKDRKGAPLIFGSSIAGAIRDYLESIKKDDDNYKQKIYKFMGGSLNNEDNDFIDSKVIINDGKISETSKSNKDNSDFRAKFIENKEGTRINSAFGTAEQKMKYEYEYIEVDNKLSFEIEYEVESKDDNEEDIKELIENIMIGFETKELRLGGQKNNDFGSFSIDSVTKYTWDLSSVKWIEDYVDYKAENKKDDNEKSNPKKDPNIYKKNERLMHTSDKYLKIKLEGEFPYGVYQNFDIGDSEKSITKLKNDRIPASSIKGLVRHHVEKMLNTIFGVGSDESNKKMEELFGGEKSAGLIRCYNVNLPKYRDENGKIRSENINQVETLDGNPNSADVTYVKINRFTGGNIDHALVSQIENRGAATIEIDIRKDDEEKYDQFVFPMIYTIAKIANGELPVGGKTNIGLGIFKADKIEISDSEIKDMIIEKRVNENLDHIELSKEKLQKYFDKFVEIKSNENGDI